MSDDVAFPSRKTMARLFDCAENTIDEMVRRGVIPPPLKLGGCVRWDWADVRAHIANRKTAAGSDPYSAGARHATQDPSFKGHRNAP